MNDTTFIYMIRNKNGEYSTGGWSPSFVKFPDGKKWTLRTLKSSLGQIKKYLNENPYYDCEIVKFELKEISSEIIAR